MDEPRSLAELLAFDDMTRAFWPSGLSGALQSPEGSLRYLLDSIDRAQLVATVPEEICSNFERVRKTYLYGLVEYDLFTVADDDARLILEGALRSRFVTYYGGEITVSRNGQPVTIRGSSFEDFRKRVKRDDVLITRNDHHHKLSLGMGGLLAWARKERLLVGQRSRISDGTMGSLRNYVAHPDGFHRHGPPDAARTLCRIAEYINKLWGTDTPGGQLFPGPIEREPRVCAMAPSGGRFVTFPNIGSARAGDASVQDGLFAVYLAPPIEELCGVHGGIHFKHQTGFQCTSFPCDLLWGPGRLNELLPELDRYEDERLRDHVEYLDRRFVVRVAGEQIDNPRSPADFAASPEEDGEWHVIRADFPQDAFCHVRDHRGRLPAEGAEGRCSECPVTELGRFHDRASTAKCVGDV